MIRDEETSATPWADAAAGSNDAGPASAPDDAARQAGTVVRAVTGALRDTHGAAATRAFAKARRNLGPIVTPVEFVHDQILRTTYGAAAVALEGIADAAGDGAVKAAEATRATSFGRSTSRYSGEVLAFVHGFNGDRIAATNAPLAYSMSLRRAGRRVPATVDGLAGAYPDARPQLVIFLHGLIGTEQMWKRHADRDDEGRRLSYGRRLEALGEHSALWVRYNTGLRIATNGRDLSALLDDVVRNWPVPVERVVLVGHSMGGLVTTSALLQWRPPATWAPLVTDLITLGTPYHGSPIEQGANFLAERCADYGGTRWLSEVIQFRSEGIKDLRPGGNLFPADTDAAESDAPGPDATAPDAAGPDATAPDAAAPDAAQWRRLLNPQLTVRHLAIAGVLTKDPHSRLGRIVGDGVVLRASARGGMDSELSTSIMMGNMSHNDLVNHPLVYRAIADFLGVPS